MNSTHPTSQLKDVFIHKVDVYGSVTNPNYFVDALQMCEDNWLAFVEESRIKVRDGKLKLGGVCRGIED
jgi:hypothetical protein